MTITPGPIRDFAQRKHDTLARLEREMDIWVATAGPDGVPCLVALWFVWHGDALWLATRFTNPTGRNLQGGGKVRLALGDTRDVVLVDGETTSYTRESVPEDAARAFEAKTGWDPRQDAASYGFFRVRPLEVQAWCEQRELPRRHLMRDGVWLTDQGVGSSRRML
ncbi:pyridoxamine 5'-phosphate oxidase family protein [Streptomyces acidiscabies]|uniref:Pyridoxamine 5'-phosphate oxidase family protein n=1 Tax=Streptomyces acidiscabies TaxID=42234 RepID=A0AAP6BF16_9ACTN|nr:pyridoxamine 5'-phosphate oxidase family protein [Streptomyces acidiscabies]MBP5934783.1 pyridoxamine 5'-phosphate oxidase [Streptomyces sp. LBUM 1476]MBZ3917474.1 pyridoxamine 5'-phosphate oxidase family protein [Streptomyces acidiscabies]MDX2963555.1 pyridoxamine 5'-phosphate oxidase family protein [Streptomyces acidiscabies]MDX3018852.1 pyridoxamine 5'-phosphate oxidase family protein [Streptomyces acidiscabies]MDX3790476.1 pyridoxamine 5'-phosphate oxidase family protein [Streptomyces a